MRREELLSERAYIRMSKAESAAIRDAVEKRYGPLFERGSLSLKPVFSRRDSDLERTSGLSGNDTSSVTAQLCVACVESFDDSPCEEGVLGSVSVNGTRLGVHPVRC